ncbi:MAG: FMN reductase, partial [Vampirovibrionia bacterium]
GGLRGFTELRILLSNINVVVLPYQLAVPGSMEVFDSNGKLLDLKIDAEITRVVKKLLSYAFKLKG